MANYAITYHTAKKWHNNDQMQLGLWLKDFDRGQSTILFDERDVGPLAKTNSTFQMARDGHFETIAGFWVKNKIIVGNVEDAKGGMLIVSKQRLNKELIRGVGAAYLYRA